MKKILFILLFPAIFISCASPFIPCVSNIHPDKIETKMFPLKTGNFWEYKYTIYEETGNETNTGIEIREIGNIDTLYYLDGDLNKINTLVYRLIMNGTVNNLYFYLKCEDGAVFARSYGYSPKEISYGRTIPEKPAAGWEDPRFSGAKWSGPEKVTVPAGTFDCWVCTYEDPFVKKRFLREYYAEGVGLIKFESMNWVYRVLSKTEMTKYKLK